MILKCGRGVSCWQPVWNLVGARLSMWFWIVKASMLFWNFGFVDPGGGWVELWDDIWERGVRMSVLFPRVRAAASDQNLCLFNVFPMCFREGWELALSTSLRGGALEEYNRFLAFIRRRPVVTVSEGPPMIVWPLTCSTVFSVKSFTAQLMFERFLGSEDFPWSTIWSKVVPVKIQCFMWLAYHGRISTHDVLQAKGFQFPNRCSLCLSQEESVSHIFIHCPFVGPIWSKISSRLSIFGPMPAKIADLISGWKGMNCTEGFSSLRLVMLHSFCWYVWLERNEVIFREGVALASRVFYRALVSSIRWLKVHAVIAQHDFEL
ncbi:hypothetical protein LINPERHAP1_LOCUS3888 [Linum perenne]